MVLRGAASASAAQVGAPWSVREGPAVCGGHRLMPAAAREVLPAGKRGEQGIAVVRVKHYCPSGQSSKECQLRCSSERWHLQATTFTHPAGPAEHGQCDRVCRPRWCRARVRCSLDSEVTAPMHYYALQAVPARVARSYNVINRRDHTFGCVVQERRSRPGSGKVVYSRCSRGSSESICTCGSQKDNRALGK